MNQINLLVPGPASAFAGLTRGRTPVPLWNEKSPKTVDWKALHAKAIGLSDGKAKNMNDDDQLAAHAKHMACAEKFANDDLDPEPPGPAEIEAANEAKAAAETALINEKAERTIAESTLKAERQAHAETLVNTALVAGKVTPAEKSSWLAKFETDFAGAKAALAQAKPALKVRARTAALGNRESGGDHTIANEKGRALKVQTLVNEKLGGKKDYSMAEYDAAFAAVRLEHPALFESMIQAENKK